MLIPIRQFNTFTCMNYIRMMRKHMLLVGMAWLVMASSGHAQSPVESHTPFALKTQAYSLLSHLVQPLVGGRYGLPFTPRYVTGAVEVGFGARHAVEFRVAMRRHDSPRWVPFSRDYLDAAYHVAWAYRYYLQPVKRGRMAGPYWSAFLTAGNSHVRFSCCEDIIVDAHTRMLALGAHAGWQLKLWNRLLIDAGIGPQLGYQLRTEGYGSAFSLDYTGFPVWRGAGGGYLRSLLLGADASIALGCLF